MSLENLTHLILVYRYWIIIPLSFAEGPIVAFVAGTLASLGYFNVYALGIFFFMKDMIVDTLYYILGHFGGSTAFAQRMLKRIGVEQSHLDKVRTLWDKHAARTMIIGKLSYGISASFIVVAGMVRMPLLKFYGWGAVAAILQYVVLLVLGYFFGLSIGNSVEKILNSTEYILLGASVIIIAYYLFTWLVARRAKEEVLENEK